MSDLDRLAELIRDQNEAPFASTRALVLAAPELIAVARAARGGLEDAALTGAVRALDNKLKEVLGDD